MTLCKSGESVFMRKDHIKLQNKTSLNIQNKLCNILYFIISFTKNGKRDFRLFGIEFLGGILWRWMRLHQDCFEDFMMIDKVARGFLIDSICHLKAQRPSLTRSQNLSSITKDFSVAKKSY